METRDHNNYWFIFQKDNLLLFKNNSTGSLINDQILDQLKPLFQRHHPLGQFNHLNCYCAEIDETATLPDKVIAVSLRKALDAIGLAWYRAATKAYAAINWDKTHQFCGRCGNATIHLPNTFERRCTHCNLSFYPRISPSMIVRITKDDEILMARSPHFTPGAYGLIAGFVEIGESIEDAVYREVKEEVNIAIKNLRYFGSQSWPFPDSLMVGFTADYASGEIVIDQREIETADWYRYDKLPGRPSSKLSLAGQLIDDFIASRTKNNGTL